MGGSLYAIGGIDKLRNVLSSIEVLNAATREWSFLPPMSTERFCCAAVDMGGNLYVIGGRDNLNDVNSSAEVLRVQLDSSLTTDSPSQEPLVQ
eukprot:14578727-Ditylum_brightwellii.AAC.1